MKNLLCIKDLQKVLMDKKSLIGAFIGRSLIEAFIGKAFNHEDLALDGRMEGILLSICDAEL